MATEKTTSPTLTRAEKTDAAKKIILQLLEKSTYKSNELIEAAATVYAERFDIKDKPNDIKGRIGSVLDVMKKENEVLFEGGMYATKSVPAPETVEEKPKKRGRKSKAETAEQTAVAEEKPKRTAKKKTAPLPPAPVQPIAPTAPVTPEIAPEPIPEDKPKKRGRKAKAETQAKEEVTKQTPKTEEIKEIKQTPAEESKEVKEVKAEEESSPKGTLMDMSFLFGNVKPTAIKTVETSAIKKAEEEKPQGQAQAKPAQPAPQKPQAKPAQKAQPKQQVKQADKKTSDEKLQEAFLERLHKLGGEYFEYYSVYLLERYSRKNGRRLEGLKITGGEHDGGIDGEIELSDKLGFRETIYIQAKNWDADKGNKKLWVVGETLLQQFLGACMFRQAKDGKRNCRGMFITTSRFTPEAKMVLDLMSDKIVGYDGADLYEAAKECQFGVVKKNGEWALDDELLSGINAFYRNF